jgi:hypothetical protein
MQKDWSSKIVRQIFYILFCFGTPIVNDRQPLQKQQAFSESSNLVVCEFCTYWAISLKDGALILYCVCDYVSNSCGLCKGW